MTRRTYAYDRELDAMVQIAGPETNHPQTPQAVIQIIRDIDPYRTAASDVAHDGKRIMVGGRRQHREFLARNGYTEVGNEMPRCEPARDTGRGGRIEDIRRALGDYGSNTGER